MDHQPPESPSSWNPRFGIRGMLLLMVVVSVMAAGIYYLIHALQGERPFRLAFVLFTVAAPLLVMVGVSILRLVLDRPGPRRHP